jgi:iron complex transport system substrate-binding protein
MRPPALTIVLLLALPGCLGGLDPGQGLRILDDTGAPVAVGDLERIVPTSVDLAEILVLLGHGHRVVAVPSWIETKTPCVQPAYPFEGVARIGKPHVLNAEEILLQRPTLVLEKDHPLQPTNLAAALRRAGVPVYVFANDESLDNVRHTIQSVAHILQSVDPQAPANAQALVEAFDAKLADVEARIGGTNLTPRTIFQLPAGLVAGRGTSADLLITHAGGLNVASQAGLTGYRQMGSEALARQDPERLIVSCTAGGSADVIFSTPKYESTTAAALAPETLRVVDPGLHALVGPRFAEAVEATARWLHPEAFGLIAADIKTHMDGRRLQLESSSTAVDGPLSLRFLPGDGHAAYTTTSTQINHTYAQPGAYEARILLIDAQNRILENRTQILVNA